VRGDLLSGRAWAILMAMSGGAPKASDRPDEIVVEDEADMTSIMSSDQARALKQAAADDTGTLERDTAKPPPMEVPPEAVAIPKAPAVPSVAPAAEPAATAPEKVAPSEDQDARKESPQPAARAAAERPATRSVPAASSAGATWELVAFVLLAASIVYALRG
jgi:hypothetical protein